jgi:hypothetical protein
MKRMTWGIVLMMFGVLFVASAGNNPQGPTGSLVMGTMCLAGGGTLTYVGWRFRSRRKVIVERALGMLRESSVIRSHDLAVASGISEITVREHLAEAQRTGLFPLKADIV